MGTDRAAGEWATKATRNRKSAKTITFSMLHPSSINQRMETKWLLHMKWSIVLYAAKAMICKDYLLVCFNLSRRRRRLPCSRRLNDFRWFFSSSRCGAAEEDDPKRAYACTVSNASAQIRRSRNGSEAIAKNERWLRTKSGKRTKQQTPHHHRQTHKLHHTTKSECLNARLDSPITQ